MVSSIWNVPSARTGGNGVTAARRHLTQQERSERTRELLMDATVDCLHELGYGRTSVHEICRRAGVSRGAQQHHFATKAELMAHAVEYLVTKLGERMREAALRVPAGPERIVTAVDLLSEGFSGSLAEAAMELWVAARTDRELREVLRPIDRALARLSLGVFQEVVGDSLPEERASTLFWLTVNLVRGLALDAMIGGDPRRRKQLLGEWKAIAVELAGR
jgi:AcrR family transcriptional regulator